MDKIEYLAYRAEDEKEDFEFYINNLEIDDRRKIIRSFWTANEIWFLQEVFINKNFTNAKQNCYHCALIDEYIITHFPYDKMDYGIDRLTYALISDKEDLIIRLANLYLLKNKQYRNENPALYMMIAAIKKEEERMENALSLLEEKTDSLFFDGLLNHDENKINKALQMIIENHINREEDGNLISEFIVHPALGYAKLATINGLEVRIDTPFIPNELMPFYPLETDEITYAFLKDN